MEICPCGEDRSPEVTALWNAVFPGYPVTESSFLRYTFAYPGFDPGGVFGAFEKGVLTGFAIATDVQTPETLHKPPEGCIPVIAVSKASRQKGIGKGLLGEAEAYLRKRGHRAIRLGYPTYAQGTALSFIGVNTEWREALWFFRHYGYAPVSLLDSARCPLSSLSLPPAVRAAGDKAAKDGFSCRALRPGEEPAFFDHLENNYANWNAAFRARSNAGWLDPDAVIVLVGQDDILGFAGPMDISHNGITAMGIGIGVDARLRGRNLGSVLLYHFLETVRSRGGQECLIYGVGPKRYYDRAGFVLSEFWLGMKKTLDSHLS